LLHIDDYFLLKNNTFIAVRLLYIIANYLLHRNYNTFFLQDNIVFIANYLLPRVQEFSAELKEGRQQHVHLDRENTELYEEISHLKKAVSRRLLQNELI